MKTTMYAAIRENEEHAFIDTSSLALTMGMVNKSIIDCAKYIPQWHNDNPVQRIVRVLIQEVE